MLPELQESSQGLSVVYLRARFRGLGFTWEFPKIRGTLFWGPYNKDQKSQRSGN